jgi:MFS family permease
VGRAPGRNRDLTLIVAAVGLTAAGDWIALTAIVLKVMDTTGSGLAVSALFIAVWGPLVLLAAPAGAMVDRFENVRLLGLVSLAQAALALALAFTLSSFAAVLVLALLIGAGTAITQPVEFALIPAVAGERDLVRANGYVETARYAGFAIGPVVGGALAGAGSSELALIADALTFLAVALAAALMRVRRKVEPEPGADVRSDRAQAGFVFLWRDRLLALVIGVSVTSLALFTICVTAEVFFIKGNLGASDVAFGVAWTAWTIGMAVGATVLARRFGPSTMATGALGMIVIQGLGIASGPVSLMYGTLLVGYAIGGAAHGTKSVLVRTLVHLRTPDRIRGRTFAAYNGLRNGAEVVALGLGGVLVATIGARAALYIAGFGPALVGLAGLAAITRFAGPGPVADAEALPADTT